MRKYTDNSYPPIGEKLTYERGDGAIVELTITHPDNPHTPQLSPIKPTGAIPPQPTMVAPLDTITVLVPPPLIVNPAANVTVPPHSPTPQRPGVSQDFGNDAVLDHLDVGGKFTAFILFYGGEEYFELHKKCLSSFLATVPGQRVDLRVGSNAINPKSKQMIDTYVERGLITKHYCHKNNDYKYPVMQEMFNDPTCPITTKWVLWLDDDTICNVEPAWLNILGMHISQHHKNNNHMIGAKFVWTTNRKQREIIEARPWFKGRPWRQPNGKPSPNGNKILFVAGGFWAITHEAIKKASIPDLGTGLTHTGGDWQIGEQLYQAGFGIKQFNGKKQFVHTSAVDRRGVTMPLIDKVATPPVAEAVTAPPVLQPPPQLSPPKLRVINL